MIPAKALVPNPSLGKWVARLLGELGELGDFTDDTAKLLLC